MTPLDNDRKSFLVVQANVFHLYTIQMIDAWAALDDAHRYQLDVEQCFDVDSELAIMRAKLTYTYKGRDADVQSFIRYKDIRNLDGSHTQRQHATDTVKVLAGRAVIRWELNDV